MGKHPAWLGKAMQSGGRAPGELDEGEQGKYLRKKALNDRVDAGIEGAKSVVGLGSAVAPIGKAKAFRTFMGAAGALSGGVAKKKWDEANKASEEADKFEPRKRGGRASKKSGK